jgi:O-antigen/teichoic acid export membrane protein
MPDSSKLLRYSSWNLMALVLPLFVGLVTIPFLLQQIGIERFGVLSLIWALVGYFSLFDFGIAKALTKKLAEGRVQHDLGSQHRIFWTSLLLMLFSGLLGGGILAGLMHGLGDSFIKVSPGVYDEVYNAVLLVAAFVPLVVVSSGLRGAMEAYEQFRIVNIIRLILGVWMFLAPAVSAWAGHATLSDMTLIILFGRVAAAIASWVFASKTMSGVGAPQFDYRLVRPLFSFGAWLTLSGILGPFMSYADRFLVGAIAGAVGVAYYATPQDVVMKLLLLPIAINAALFPIFAKALAAGDSEATFHTLYKALRYTVIGLLPFVMAAQIFPLELLTIWLGGEMASYSAPVLQLIAAGVLLNGIGVVMVSVLNAAGRPDVLGKLYLIELPLFLLASYTLTMRYGVAGAAWAWMVRTMLDTILVWFFTRPHLGKMAATYLSTSVLCFAPITIAAGLQRMQGQGVKMILSVMLCAVTVLMFERLFRAGRLNNQPMPHTV